MPTPHKTGDGSHATVPLHARPRTGADSCLELLRDALVSRAGILSLTVNRESSQLSVGYDPNRVSMRQVCAWAKAIGVELGGRFEHCTLKTPTLQCRDCVRSMDRSVGATPGITAASCNPGSFTIGIEYDPATINVAQIQERIESLGVKVRQKDESELFWRRYSRILATTLCALGLVAGLVARALEAPSVVSLTAFGLAYVAGGFFALGDFLRSVRQWRLDINALMLIAAVGAGLINHWDDGAALLFLFSLSNTLENYAMGRTRRAVQALMKLSPQEARLVRDGQELAVSVDELVVGDVVRVRPGDLLPADGTVVAGQSSVNQAAITGESVPVDVAPGDSVFAGTLNQHGALDIRVGKPSAESALAKVVKVVEAAQSQKAAVQRAIERFGEVYSPVVLVVAAGAILLPVWLWNVSFETAFYRAMVLLVAASPCALIISTPAAALSAIANGARRGILFKSSNAVEDTSQLKVIALDKTGTLTVGQPELNEVLATSDLSADELLRLAASAEQRSEHPLAQAVVRAARGKGARLEEPVDFRAWPGEGLQAEIGSRVVFIGNDKLLARVGVSLDAEHFATRERLASQGKTVVHVFDSERLLGLLGLADRPRPEASGVVKALQSQGLRVVMLTGDHKTVARAIGAAVGIDEVHAGLSPEQKVEIVRRLNQATGHVAMVGDGVNDAPALASATVGFAMGAAGSDVALETADVVLMGDDLTAIPYAVGLGRKARRVVKQNITFALGVIVALVTINYAGHLPLPLGVVGHEGSTLLVALNGLRLLRPLPVSED